MMKEKKLAKVGMVLVGAALFIAALLLIVMAAGARAGITPEQGIEEIGEPVLRLNGKDRVLTISSCERRITGVPKGVTSEEAYQLITGRTEKVTVWDDESFSLSFEFPLPYETWETRGRIIRFADGRWSETPGEISSRKSLSTFCMFFGFGLIWIVSMVTAFPLERKRRILWTGILTGIAILTFVVAAAVQGLILISCWAVATVVCLMLFSNFRFRESIWTGFIIMVTLSFFSLFWKTGWRDAAWYLLVIIAIEAVTLGAYEVAGRYYRLKKAAVET